MALPKGSGLLPFFNHAYNKLRQNGALRRIKAKWEDKNNFLKCEANSLDSISIVKMGSLLVMLLSGMALASIILIFENICKTQGLKASTAAPYPVRPARRRPYLDFEKEKAAAAAAARRHYRGLTWLGRARRAGGASAVYL